MEYKYNICSLILSLNLKKRTFQHILVLAMKFDWQNPEWHKRLKRNSTSEPWKPYRHGNNFFGFLPLFISVQFPNCNILIFFTLKTQPCTIQSSKSLLLQPQLKIVYPKPHFPVARLSFFKDRERPAEVCQMDQQFLQS